MKLAGLVPLLALTACSFGFGSAYVGQWRPRTHVDVDACLVDDAGQCRDHKQIVTAEPARRFWGVIVPLPALGAAHIDHAGHTTTSVRAEPGLEILSGYGKLAWGVRGSVLFEDHTVATPITAIGHLSLSPRFGIYAGAGYSPYARIAGDHMPSETTALGGQVLAGAQIALARALVLSLEADSTWLDVAGGYHSFGLTGQLGLFL